MARQPLWKGKPGQARGSIDPGSRVGGEGLASFLTEAGPWGLLGGGPGPLGWPSAAPPSASLGLQGFPAPRDALSRGARASPAEPAWRKPP